MDNIKSPVEGSAAFIGAATAKGTVLLVDDEASLRTALRTSLEQAGYDVLEAQDGVEAIQAITCGEKTLLVDIVLAGLHMPRINGVEEVASLRQHFPHVEVIVMTGWHDQEVATALLASGVRDFLVKPFVAQRVLSAVDAAMAQRRMDWLE